MPSTPPDKAVAENVALPVVVVVGVAVVFPNPACGLKVKVVVVLDTTIPKPKVFILVSNPSITSCVSVEPASTVWVANVTPETTILKTSPSAITPPTVAVELALVSLVCPLPISPSSLTCISIFPPLAPPPVGVKVIVAGVVAAALTW